MLNQIEIWFNQNLCLGVYTKRMRWGCKSLTF